MVTRILRGGGSVDNPYIVADVGGKLLADTNMSVVLSECARHGVDRIKYPHSGRYLILRDDQWFLTSDSDICDKVQGLPSEGKLIKVKSFVTDLPCKPDSIEVPTDSAKYLELKTYRKAGINAYLVAEGQDHTHNIYGKPATDEDKELSYRGKLHTVKIKMDDIADGRYRFKEAGGAHFKKSRYGFITIKEGEVVEKINA